MKCAVDRDFQTLVSGWLHNRIAGDRSYMTCFFLRSRCSNRGSSSMRLIRRAAFALATLTLSHAALANDGLTSGACVISTGPAATGSVFAMQDLPGGGVLIGAQNGLFRLDPPSGHIISSLARTIGSVRAMHDLPGG